MVSFPPVSPPKPCAQLSPPPYAPHAPPISFFSILPPAQYWVRSTDHYNTIPYLSYTYVKIFLSFSFTVTCALFNDAYSNSYYEMSYVWMLVKDGLQQYRIQLPWPNLRYFPRIFLERLRNPTETSVKTRGCSLAIRARHFPEYKSEVLRLEPAYLTHLIYSLFYQATFCLQNVCNCCYRTSKCR